MTAAELIAELSKLPPETTLYVDSADDTEPELEYPVLSEVHRLVGGRLQKVWLIW
ncbi:hypothetical protein ACFWJS_33770 [Streptomyces sp. NPDC127061]|uniref:hypothetical protein n=1 Tax=Streptomyces sp. NPDC127061 TaxID=3347122 RepID=UPI00366908AF